MDRTGEYLGTCQPHPLDKLLCWAVIVATVAATAIADSISIFVAAAIPMMWQVLWSTIIAFASDVIGAMTMAAAVIMRYGGDGGGGGSH